MCMPVETCKQLHDCYIYVVCLIIMCALEYTLIYLYSYYKARIQTFLNMGGGGSQRGGGGGNTISRNSF